tara:strand:+ start:159 stop:638 length:480 start_codon:yes stop_codon:yes gene_type:complete
MNIYKNFLPKKDFKKIQDRMMGDYFPWYFKDGINDIPDNYFQFTFQFLNEKGEINCSKEMMDILQPILSKIKYKKLNRLKANLLIRDINITEHGMHIDQNEGITGIFYVNTCNGYTKFENGMKIKSEENKYIEFNSILKHSGSSCTDEKRRVVINFNYQ